MAGRVYHWKHGWIPLDRYAAVEKSHGRDNAVVQQLNDRIVSADAGNRQAAEARVSQLGQLLPPELKPSPHSQFPVRNFSIAGTIPAHHTGGVVFNRLQTRALVRHAAAVNEGAIDSVDQGQITGTRPARRVGIGTHGPEAEAKANARTIKALLDLPVAPLPEIVLQSDGHARYTGGLKLDGPTADALIKRLQSLRTGTMSRSEARQAAGLR